jgi:hypothetical protein
MAESGEPHFEAQLGGRYGGLRRLGNFIVPARVAYSYEGKRGEPDIKATFEIHDGRPECMEFTITAKRDGRGLRTADLRVFDLTEMAVGAFLMFATVPRPSQDEPDAVLLFPPRDEAEVRRAERDIYEARAARRGAVTRAELEEVARIYRKHIKASPTKAVEMVLGYPPRTAARRVEQARAAGLLPKTTQGKRKA